MVKFDERQQIYADKSDIVWDRALKLFAEKLMTNIYFNNFK